MLEESCFPTANVSLHKDCEGSRLSHSHLQDLYFRFFVWLFSLKLSKVFASPSVKYAIWKVLQKLPYCLPRYQRHISPYLSIIEKL